MPNKRKKTALDLQRDAAFSLEFKSRGDGPSTRIVDMIVIHDRMIVFKEDCIFEAKTPDNIDPERKHPKTKGSTHRLYEIGTRDPIVARSIINAKRLVESVVFSSPISKEDIINKAFDIFHELHQCNKFYTSLVSSSLSTMEDADKIITNSTDRQFIGDIPQIPHLEDNVRNFFLAARKAIVEISSLTDIFFPEKVNVNKPYQAQDYDRLHKWLLGNLGKDNKLYELVNDDLSWITLLWEIRNAIEHKSSPGYNFELRNIEIAPNCKLYGPRWRYSCPAGTQENFTDIVLDIEAYLNNLLSFGEDILATCICEKWNKKIPFILFKLAENDIDPICPNLYGITINVDLLNKRSKEF